MHVVSVYQFNSLVEKAWHYFHVLEVLQSSRFHS
jgi:hypothetical protein